MERMTIGEIAEICGARICGVDANLVINEVSTDTRKISGGELFVPLAAARDGHDFIPAARAAGAAAVLSSREGEEERTLYVSDTFEALKKIAREQRRRCGVRVAALTGSVGKTTTKEMTAAVLARAFSTLKTAGNLNNTLGVPLTLLRLDRSYEAAVIEMGMNHFGEIRECTTTAEPDVAMITNIGTAHIEFLGSREGIAKAKLEICEGMRAGSAIILNGDEPLLRDRSETAHLKTVYFGIDAPDCDIKAENIIIGDDSTAFDVSFGAECVHVTLPQSGRHFVYDALAAFAAGLEFGVSSSDIAAGLADFVSGRQTVSTASGFTMIEDYYNANPESMAAALEVLKTRSTSGRRIAVLGDMLELGAHSAEAHRGICERAAAAADAIFLYGSEFAAVAEYAGSSARVFGSHKELAAALAHYAQPGDLLLFKGSRSMRMELVLEMFRELAC